MQAQLSHQKETIERLEAELQACNFLKLLVIIKNIPKYLLVLFFTNY